VFLSGTVRDQVGAPVDAADVNVFEVSTGISLALGHDNTNAAGFYSVVVPRVLVDVVFSPPDNPSPLAKDRHNNVNITANTTLDGQFPTTPTHVSQHPGLPKPPPLPFSQGSPGTGGSVPHIRGALASSSMTLWFTGGRPGASAQLLLGFDEETSGLTLDIPMVAARARLPLVLDSRGEAQLTLSLPNTALVGRALHVQLAVLDPEATNGVAVSHILALQRSE